MAVVGTDNKVTIRSVQTGERVDTMWVITSGLTAGDRVVAEGVQKVKDGSTVTPTPFTTAPGPAPFTTASGPAPFTTASGGN